MTSRLFVLLLTLYLGADFADPLLPGVVQFVDGDWISGAELSTPEPVQVDEVGRISAQVDITPTPVRQSTSIRRVPLRPRFSLPRLIPPSDPASPADDH